MKTILFPIGILVFFIFGCEQNPLHPEKLSQHQWELVQYGAGIGMTTPIEGSRVTLRFEKDSIRGQAGCNEYSGEWEYRDADYIAVSGQIGTTENYCDGLMKQEDLYLRMLSEVSTFIVGDTFLQLSGSRGFLVFAPTLPDGNPPPAPPTLIMGYYMAGNEVSIFRDCADTTTVFWLEDETTTLDSLYRVTTGGQQYQPVLLEMDAARLPRLNLGYASEYDGLIRVKRIRKIEMPDPEDACFSRMDWG